MTTTSWGLRSRLLELYQPCLGELVHQKYQQGVTETDAQGSMAGLVQHLRSFSEDLEQLTEDDREALLAVFRDEMRLLLTAFQLEAATLRFLPPHLR